MFDVMALDIIAFIEMLILVVLFAWIAYVVYNIVYYPRKAFKLLPVRLRSWSLLQRFGVTDRSKTFRELDDRFTTLRDVTQAMRSSGLETANLIIGIDFTASNEWQGRKTFGGRSLHHIEIDAKSGKVSKWNPYQKVIRTIGETLADFDEDSKIPVYGFGDAKTKDVSVFPLMNDETPCEGVEDVLLRYTRTVGSVSLSGPTSFAPIIRKAIEIVRDTGKYHVLLILADGRLEEKQDQETRKAIVEASNFAVSIVVVGVGDGPWDAMHLYDDGLPQRRFDNFQFVEFQERKAKMCRDSLTDFALNALMEIPDQYNAIKGLGLLKPVSSRDRNRNNEKTVHRRSRVVFKTPKHSSDDENDVGKRTRMETDL